MGDVDGVNESMAPNPQSIYGASKLVGRPCSAFAFFNLPTYLRFSNIWRIPFRKTSDSDVMIYLRRKSLVIR